MTRLNISVGTSANDGTGDTLRAAGQKINSNFAELYAHLNGGDSASLSNKVSFDSDGILFEGASANDFETKLVVTDPTADRIVTIPNATGTIVFKDTTDTLTNKTLTTPTIASITNGGTVTIPSGADTLVARTSTDTLTNKTLTTPTINSPRIGTLINDANGAEIIKLTATTSAQNEITIANAAGSNAPSITTTGDATDINLDLTAKGTGSINLSKAAFSSTTVSIDASSIVSGTLIIGNKNSGGTLTLSLPNGTTTGEYKIFINKGSQAMEVTPVSFAQGSKFTLAANDGCTCVWGGAGTNWFLVGNQSSVTVV